MRKHLAGLVDVNDVTTVSVSRALFALQNAADVNDLAVVLGAPGTGKTHCAARFLETVAAGGRRTMHLQTDTGAAHTTMTVRLLQGLQGGRPTGDGWMLTDDLCELLADQQPVVVVDDLHLAQSRGIEQLISLKDRVDDWALILIGSELPSRLTRLPGAMSRALTNTVQLQPLEGAELIAALQCWHRLFRDADPMLLLRVNDRYCHGKFRAWAGLLRGALRANDRLRAQGKAPVATFNERLTGLAVAATGLDVWAPPA